MSIAGVVVSHGHAAELVTSLCITISYLGWTSAQMIALGLVFNALSGGALYFFFAFVPIFLAYSAFLIAPEMVKPLPSPLAITSTSATLDSRR